MNSYGKQSRNKSFSEWVDTLGHSMGKILEGTNQNLRGAKYDQIDLLSPLLGEAKFSWRAKEIKGVKHCLFPLNMTFIIGDLLSENYYLKS